MLTTKEPAAAAVAKVKVLEYLSFVAPSVIICFSGLPDMPEGTYSYGVVVDSNKAKPSEHVNENLYRVKIIDGLTTDTRVYDERQFMTALDALPMVEFRYPYYDDKISVVEMVDCTVFK